MEEWDPEKGGEKIPYVPKLFLCMGCKSTGDILEDAYKTQHKIGGSTNGIKVHLIPRAVVELTNQQERERAKIVAASRRAERDMKREVEKIG